MTSATSRMSIGYPQNRHVCFCRFNAVDDYWYEQGYFGTHKVDDSKIVAWMDLPKAYEDDCEWTDKK